jgi:hypothetical protein
MENKITQEELASIKKYQQTYLDLTNQFGAKSLERFRLNLELEKVFEKLESLETQIRQCLNDESNFLKQIESKYGICTIDIDTGEILK